MSATHAAWARARRGAFLLVAELFVLVGHVRLKVGDALLGLLDLPSQVSELGRLPLVLFLPQQLVRQHRRVAQLLVQGIIN